MSLTLTTKVLEESLSHFVAFDVNAEERNFFIKRVIEAVEEGKIDALQVHLYLKQQEAILDGITKHPSFKRMLLDEAEKYGKIFVFRNAQVQVKETGVKYDYTECGDPELAKLQEQYDLAKAALDARQKFLKNLHEPLTVVNEETGEVYTIYPPSKSSTTSVAVTLK